MLSGAGGLLGDGNGDGVLALVGGFLGKVCDC